MKLYEYAPTRSARCRWTLQELGLEFESVSARELLGTEEYRRIHPHGKIPALEIDGKILFESAAICTYLTDLHPEAGLGHAAATWERALHDQWVSFALTEMEAWLWSTGKHTFVYPEEKRVKAIYEPNAVEVKAAARVLDGALAERDYLVGGGFSVTDIIVGYTVNWARMLGLLEGQTNLQAYLKRLFARPHCTLNQEGA